MREWTRPRSRPAAVGLLALSAALSLSLLGFGIGELTVWDLGGFVLAGIFAAAAAAVVAVAVVAVAVVGVPGAHGVSWGAFALAAPFFLCLGALMLTEPVRFYPGVVVPIGCVVAAFVASVLLSTRRARASRRTASSMTSGGAAA